MRPFVIAVVLGLVIAPVFAVPSAAAGTCGGNGHIGRNWEEPPWGCGGNSAEVCWWTPIPYGGGYGWWTCRGVEMPQ